MGRYFGTDGIRGRFGFDSMTEAFAFRLAQALARFIQSKSTTGQIVVGRDTRASGLLLERALQKGFEDAGLSVIFLGVVPTPAVAMGVLHHSAPMGIALTASHNPASDNGIKLFNERGEKYSLADEVEIEAFIDQVAGEGESEYKPEDAASTASFEYTGADFYQSALLANFPPETLKELEGMKIVLDCANGATYQTAPSVLKALGAELVLIGVSPDGENINHKVGSECPDLLAETVLAEGAALGIAHDGDGDRIVVCDERGSIVDGDALLGLFALSALRRQSLAEKTLVVTVQSNLGLDRAVLAAGGRIERVAIGDRNVAEKMRAIGAHLGGESSGHILFTEVCPTGDGLLAALFLLQTLQSEGRSLSELQAEIQLFPQVTQNLRVKKKIPLEDLPSLQKVIGEVETELAQSGRLLIRYSGTESKLRILIEAEAVAVADRLMQIIVTEACNSLSIL